jgi:hypothetical protein
MELEINSTLSIAAWFAQDDLRIWVSDLSLAAAAVTLHNEEGQGVAIRQSA